MPALQYERYEMMYFVMSFNPDDEHRRMYHAHFYYKEDATVWIAMMEIANPGEHFYILER
jgi:hypothetical protein